MPYSCQYALLVRPAVLPEDCYQLVLLLIRVHPMRWSGSVSIGSDSTSDTCVETHLEFFRKEHLGIYRSREYHLSRSRRWRFIPLTKRPCIAAVSFCIVLLCVSCMWCLCFFSLQPYSKANKLRCLLYTSNCTIPRALCQQIPYNSSAGVRVVRQTRCIHAREGNEWFRRRLPLRSIGSVCHSVLYREY